MADDPQKPPLNAVTLDASHLMAFLFDLPPKATVGMKGERPGLDLVMKELNDNQEKYGVMAQISAADLARLLELTSQIEQIRNFRPAVSKLDEILNESEAYLDNERYRILSVIRNTILQRARLGNSAILLAVYEKLDAYIAEIGKKAADTRKKNKEEEKNKL